MLPCAVSMHIALEGIFIENTYEWIDILEKDGNELIGFNGRRMILGQGKEIRQNSPNKDRTPFFLAPFGFQLSRDLKIQFAELSATVSLHT